MTIRLVTPEDEGPSGDLLRQVIERRGKDANFYRLFTNSPEVFEPLWRLVLNLWKSPNLDRKHLELIILRVSVLTGASYEWVQHVPMARDAGLSDDEMRAVATWQVSNRFDDTQRHVLAAVDGLVQSRLVPEPIAQALVAELGTAATVELLTAVGLYVTVAGALRTAKVGFEPWAAVDDPVRFPGYDPVYPHTP